VGIARGESDARPTRTVNLPNTADEVAAHEPPAYDDCAA